MDNAKIFDTLVRGGEPRRPGGRPPDAAERAA